MIFLRYERPKEYWRLYPVTTVILGINVALFLLMELFGSSRSTSTLLKFGAMYGSPSPLVESAGMWRYFTSTFLHIGFEHLLFNCFALYIFAPPLERMLGAVKYAIFYMGSGYIGSLASDVFHTSNYVSAGASGAVYGIYAAYLFLALFRKHVLDEQSSKVITIIIIMGVVYSIIVPHVNLLAHLGGFVGGAILFALLGYSIGRNRRIG